MKRIIALLLTIAAVSAYGHPALAFVSPAFAFHVARAPHPLPLDPSLSDPAWQAGKIDGGAFENETTRSSAPHTTQVYVLYDERALYVAFEAEQNGTPIVASQTTNDVGFGIDDFVGIGIDTSNAGSQAYLFMTTPRGVRYEQASENARYRPQWQSATKVTGGTWRAVMIIPLSDIRFRSANSQTWRVNFFRSVATVGEHYVWAFNGVMQDAPQGQWPSWNDLRFWAAGTGIDLQGSAFASHPKPRAEVYGLASIGLDRDLFQQSNGSFLPEPARPYGLDLSVPLTPTINFVGTANPDFSNVEIDQQTIAPQEFRRQLTEYRPFFSQGASYINANPQGYTNNISPSNLIFYSQDVGPFDSGAKAEGTFGLQSFGLLTFHGFDQVTGDTFNDVAYGYRHALQNQTFQYWSDGVIANHTVSGYDNTVEAGFKGRNLQNGLVWYADTAVEQGSWVPNGVAHSTNGFIDVHKPNYEVYFGYVDLSPNYNPIDGYTSNSDIHGFQEALNFVGSMNGVKSYDLFILGDRFFDQSGAVHESDTGALLNATFKNGFSLDGLGPTISYLRGYDTPTGPNCTGPSSGENYFTGFPCYRNGIVTPYNLMAVPIGYRDGTPSPVDVSVNWGNFSTNYLHYYTFTTARPIGNRIALGLEYDMSYEQPLSGGALQSQFLRRISLGFNTGSDSNLTLSLRDINGLGGFSTQEGLNFAAGFHTRIRNGDLYVDWGTPAASATLYRFIVKLVMRAGGDVGT